MVGNSQLIVYHILDNDVAIFASVVTPSARYTFYSSPARLLTRKRRETMSNKSRDYSQEISMVYLNLGRKSTEKGKGWLGLRQKEPSELKHLPFRRNILFHRAIELLEGALKLI